MKRLVLCSVFALSGCLDVPAGGGGLGGSSGGGGASGGFREYLVLGSSMSFESCRARGGLIIRDQGSPMVACDPRVLGTPASPDEFNHPGSPVPQVAAEPTPET